MMSSHPVGTAPVDALPEDPTPASDLSLLEALDVLAEGCRNGEPDNALSAYERAALSRLEDLRAAVELAGLVNRACEATVAGTRPKEPDGSNFGRRWNHAVDVSYDPDRFESEHWLVTTHVPFLMRRGATPLEALRAALGQGQQDAGE